jgi:hypothetical protein
MSKYDEIKSKHRGEFIAIFNGEITGDINHQSLLERSAKKLKTKI